MAAKLQVSVEEYLRTSYDNPDREYVDGEIVERAAPDNLHSAVQFRLIEIFGELRRKHRLHIRPELRQRVSEKRFRITDVAVFAGQAPSERVPTAPPYIAIEIVSPEDRFTEILEKLDEYRNWGVAHVWLVDPQFRRFCIYGSSGLAEVMVLELPEYGVALTPSEVFSEI